MQGLFTYHARQHVYFHLQIKAYLRKVWKLLTWGGWSDLQNLQKWEFAWDQNAQRSCEKNMLSMIYGHEIFRHFASTYALMKISNHRMPKSRGFDLYNALGVSCKCSIQWRNLEKFTYLLLLLHLFEIFQLILQERKLGILYWFLKLALICNRGWADLNPWQP